VSDVETWTTNEVVEWAKGVRGVRVEDVEVLRKQVVEGTALLSLSEDKLTRHPYNLPGGPAALLMIAVEKLKTVFGTGELAIGL
jgi:hypothetical protein